LLVAVSARAQKDSVIKQAAGTDTIEQRIVLIGDAGQLTNGHHPVVDAVKRFITLDSKTTVLYLGDNLYKTGLPDSQAITYRVMRAVIDSELSVVEGTPSRLWMIPGNHDWKNGGADGFDAVMREQLYVNFKGQKNVHFVPEDGCPGPIEINVTDNIVVIAFDSQWWLHPHFKPGIESDCPCKTQDELVSQIQELATKNAKKLVILACHHPFKSNGTHGGFYTLKQHIFPLTDMKPSLYIPLPIIGSIYPISRSVFGTPQDLKHPVYQTMVNDISAVLKDIPNLVFVAGHDHNLQHIVDSSHNYIISGGGCKINRSSKPKNSKYNNPNTGFAVMTISKNKNVSLDFYLVTDTATRKDYTAFLLNFSKIPEEKKDTNAIKVEDPFLKYKDTFTVAASDKFQPIYGLRKFFMGENYRKEWSTPVNMKVFNISKEMGGFNIRGMGGGKQTKSLRLENKATKKKYFLRIINRDPERSIPEGFRNTLAKGLLKELSSSSYPYGALTFPKLADALDVNVAHPKLFFVPDDPVLGFYRPYFANHVCMLEEEDASFDGSDTKTTSKLLAKMLDENDHRPASNMVLQARLLDMLTADYDRHLDQWRWGSIDTGKGKIYYPIPRDRDQAYFNSDGLLIRFISSRAMPFLKGYRYNIEKPKWLGYVSRDFDHIFLTDLDEAAWKERLDDFRGRLSDSLIRDAFKQLPPEIFAIHGETMVQKMISRRNALEAAALKYYKYLAKRVNVLGSNQKEYFKVNNSEDGGLHVRVYARSKGNDTSFIMFDRVFKSHETREVHLYGLNDDDLFEIEPGTHSPIKIRIIGGQGNDTFNIRGNVENLLYDIKYPIEKNVILDSSHSKNRFESDPPVNEKSIFGYQYNINRFPRVHLDYNSDEGGMIGAGFARRTFGFRNLPYASDQVVSMLYNLDKKAFNADYKGVFNHVTRGYDLLLNLSTNQPGLRNFLGFGNNTKAEDGRNLSYYLTRYRSFEATIFFRKRFFENAHLMIGPQFSHYNVKLSDNRQTILGSWEKVNLDSARLFRPKNYAGVKMAFLVDNRNKDFFPTRGVHWLTEITGLGGVTKGSNNLIKYTTDMVLYASFQQAAKMVAVLKWGGGRIYNKNFEYFQGLSLGANNNLNGFRNYRYTGRALFYTSLELKFKLFDINSFILPGPFGLTTFYDGGRVWNKNEHSKTWHSAIGAGFYYLPFNVLNISASIGYSKGEKMLIYSIGTKINLFR
jgi:hypothetical protein